MKIDILLRLGYFVLGVLVATAIVPLLLITKG